MILRLTLLTATLLAAAAVHADPIDDLIRAEMQKRQIPGLSLAIIDGGRIVKVKGYGVTERGGKVKVSTTTLFMAGSVSKPVSAAAALHLVEQGKLALDADVNQTLRAWKVPENGMTADQKVTLRRLLSHTAGLTVHGFPGYAVGAPVPTTVQVLDGVAPANTAPVRVDLVPGSQWRYSGGGYTVMQQLVEDVTATPFADYLAATVLKPFGMRDSSFRAPPAAPPAAAFATGHYGDRSLVEGRWHLYPELAAAGLWTHAADLSRFSIGIQRSLAGKANPVLSPAMTRQMLTEQKDSFGLGLALKGSGKTLRFSHNGRDEGFDATLVAFAQSGQGAVIMINANDNSRMMERLLDAIGQRYHWPDAAGARAAMPVAAPISQATLDGLAGRYEFYNNFMLTLMANKDGLVSMSDGLPDEQFIAVGGDRFASASGKRSLAFTKDERGAVTGFVASDDGKERKVPRIAPLIASLAPLAEPDAARTGRVQAALAAAAAGSDAAAASSQIAAGMKKNVGSNGMRELAGIRSMTFLSEQSVAARGIERHGSAIESVLLYKIDNPGGRPYLMVFLDAAGLVGDYDLVDN